MDFELSFIATKKLSVSPTESGRMVPPKFKVRIKLRILKGYLCIVLNCEKCPYYVEVASIDITKFLSSTQFFIELRICIVTKQNYNIKSGRISGLISF